MSLVSENVKSGSILGGMLLMSGSCIGAGMLGLPILTGMAGFLPSLIMFVVAWAFMTTTGLLLVEVNSWTGESANLLSMVHKTLGRSGKVIAWILYLFLFYTLAVAYLAGSANHISYFFKQVLSLNFPSWLSSSFFVLLFGWLVYLGTRPVDLFNRGLMFAKIIVYISLIILGSMYIVPKYLLHVDFKYSFFSIPILIISFGFHNMIPSLFSYMGGDIKRVKTAIILGSTFTLCIYIFWEVIALGILPLKGDTGILNSYHKGVGAAQALRSTVGSSALGIFAQLLAFLAILTSFIAQSLGLVHFLRDGLNVPKKERENIGLCLLAMVPPLICSIAFPNIFFLSNQLCWWILRSHFIWCDASFDDMGRTVQRQTCFLFSYAWQKNSTYMRDGLCNISSLLPTGKYAGF